MTGNVNITGALGINTIIFTLPVGFRPSAHVGVGGHFGTSATTAADNINRSLFISPEGQVILRSNGLANGDMLTVNAV